MKIHPAIAIVALTVTTVAAQTPPPGFVPPALHPEGVTLAVEELGEGVYALMSSRPPVDDAGFVVGERGVLVIDAHINETMARQILAAVRAVTEKPILYLVNTNYHADHTFGNDVFPETTRVVAHRETEILMRGFEQQKKSMLVTVRHDPSVFQSAILRLPDVVFSDSLELDLGGRRVELHHFGAGNTLGDTVVYVPEVRAVWTGNLVFGDGSLPFLLAGHPRRYHETIARFADTLDVATIIPGHGVSTTPAVLDRYLDYLETLAGTVDDARQRGWTLEQTLERSPLPERFAIPAGLSSTAFYRGLHPFNLQRAFLETE